MEAGLVQWLQQYPEWAVLISLALSVGIAIAGLLPSVFITAANILYFGLGNGLLLSLAGEALGAVVAFLLYRKGFKKGVSTTLEKHPRLQALIGAEGGRAFGLIFLLRLLPFVPSGLVTFAAAIGRVTLPTFALASTLGKIPALLLEALSVAGLLELSWRERLPWLIGALVVLVVIVLKQKKEAP